ncbi:MAG: hypothetical protein WBM40_17670 [Thiohalocapsa sp.]
MTLSAVATELGIALGLAVRCVPLTAASYAIVAGRARVPIQDAVPIAALIAEVLVGRNAALTDGMQ